MEVPFETLVGKTIVTIDGLTDGNIGNVIFYCSDGSAFKMYHDQDCCETVGIEEIIGDVNYILNEPVLHAYKSESTDDEAYKKATGYSEPDSHTWTFYRIITHSGEVTIRWLGESNGYYSESVSFEELIKDDV